MGGVGGYTQGARKEASAAGEDARWDAETPLGTPPCPPPLIGQPPPLPQHLPVNLNFSQLLQLEPLCLMPTREDRLHESLPALAPNPPQWLHSSFPIFLSAALQEKGRYASELPRLEMHSGVAGGTVARRKGGRGLGAGGILLPGLKASPENKQNCVVTGKPTVCGAGKQAGLG